MIRLFATTEISLPGLGAAVAALALAAVGTAILVWGKKGLVGTTLIAPWWWALGSLWAIAAVEAVVPWLARGEPNAWTSVVRYAVATTSFCPLMAALGAKRPQDKAWQFIVLSLWGILILPAAEAVVYRGGQSFEVNGAWSWFLLALTVVGAANTLPTRFWLSSLLMAAAQILLMLRHLPWANLAYSPSFADSGALVGLALGVAAIAVAAVGFPGRRASVPPLDRLWLDFRDTFGALWGLRVAERVNAAAALYNWPIGLSWSGFHAADGSPMETELPDDLAGPVRQSLDNLLRRFVSSEWIAARLDGTAETL